MYIAKRRNTAKNDYYVYLLENYWDKAKGRSATKIIKSFGLLSDLVREDPDAFEKLADFYRKQTLENKHRVSEEILETLKNPLVTEETKLQSGKVPALNYTNYMVRALWKQLRLDQKIIIGKRKTKIEFDLDRVLQFMVSCKLVHPGSYLKSWDRITQFVGTQNIGIDLQHLYRSLDFLCKNKDSMLEWINKELCLSSCGRDLSMVFYDVTNTWFETLYDDNARACRAAAKESNSSMFEMEQEGVVAQEPLRMRGPSKEKRYDMPLISVALVIDREGIPVDYRVYAGNRSEKVEFAESIERLREHYGISQSVIVADRGLNSASNVFDLLQNGQDFLVAQSVHQLDKQTLEKVLCSEGWEEHYNGSLRIKEVPYTKNSEKGDIDCRLIVTLRDKRLVRELEEFKRNWFIARQALQQGTTLDKGRDTWKGYVVYSKGKPLRMNENKIRKDLSLLGLYGIITSVKSPKDKGAKPNETLSSLQVAEQYQSLTRIEDCFRVMKSAFNLRPVFAHKDEHIYGHVHLCVLSLILLRLLEKQLKNQKTPLSTDEIQMYMRKAEVVPITLEKGKVFYQPLKCAMRTMRTESLRFKDDDKVDGADLLMQACGLTPIRSVCDRVSLGRCLKTRFKSDVEIVHL